MKNFKQQAIPLPKSQGKTNFELERTLTNIKFKYYIITLGVQRIAADWDGEENSSLIKKTYDQRRK